MRSIKVWAVLWVACVGAGAASAQTTTYHCRDSNGNSYSLSRPCPSDARTTAVSGGPARTSSYSSSGYASSSSRSAPRSDEPDHFQYLSERCRSLKEAMRTGYSRGLKSSAIADLQREYQRDCRDEEEAAYTRYSSERSSRRKEQREEEKAVQLADKTARDNEERYLQQCAESRRILQTKKARTDLTPGERDDLKRFEDNFNSRCKR